MSLQQLGFLSPAVLTTITSVAEIGAGVWSKIEDRKLMKLQKEFEQKKNAALVAAEREKRAEAEALERIKQLEIQKLQQEILLAQATKNQEDQASSPPQVVYDPNTKEMVTVPQTAVAEEVEPKDSFPILPVALIGGGVLVLGIGAILLLGGR
jgi:hypothetical protein